MDADANGQVGGLDVSEDVRREYARQSRGWVCEVCGESNESVLQTWREDCRERGMKTDGDGGDKEEKNAKEKELDRSPGRPTTTAPAPTVSSSTSAPAEPPSSSAAQEHRLPVNIASVGQPAAAQGQSSDGPWLDRAIVGVLLALVFMILRKLVNTDEQL